MLFPARPDVLNRIEFGRIVWQIVDFDQAARRVEIFLDEFAAMRREAIPNDQQRRLDMTPQAAKEINDFRALDTANV